MRSSSGPPSRRWRYGGPSRPDTDAQTAGDGLLRDALLWRARAVQITLITCSVRSSENGPQEVLADSPTEGSRFVTDNSRSAFTYTALGLHQPLQAQAQTKDLPQQVPVRASRLHPADQLPTFFDPDSPPASRAELHRKSYRAAADEDCYL